MERIGIYGGTFNPPHVGHVRAAQYARQALGLDRVLMIPDHVPPHKQLPEGSPTPLQRLEMLRLAVENTEGLEASTLSLDRDGATYAWETVAEVRKLHPDAKLVFLMGTDMFLSFLNWRNPEKIWQEAELAAFCRGEKGEQAQLAMQKQKLEELGAKVHLLSNPVTAISSTMLRRMLVLRCPGEFLEDAVKRYVYDHGLYAAGRELKNLPIDVLEKVAVSLLKPNRVAHVLGCRQTAGELARLWGADETDAQRAALLHDITKAMDGPLQLTLCREYGIILDNFSSENPKTLHALPGSYAAERIFGENAAVVNAIRSHTTGKANMNLLEKIIYVADYMEPNRDFPGVEELRRLAYTDMDKALKLGLTMTLDMLKKQNRQISPQSLDALRYLEESGV